MRKLLLVLALTVATAGCGVLYRQPIYQGNLLEKTNVEQLQQGMDKRQVMNLLGSPSIADPFHHSRWDYTSTQRTGRRGKTEVKTLTVYFAGEQVSRWEGELVESFSHGMKQRLVMCAAFLHRPQAVLVDEPMVGLDPRGARLIKDVLRTMSRRGVAILMSTHTLEVAQEMCDRIAIILKGKIIARGTVSELLALAGGEDEQLTPVFLKLTGGSGLQEIDEL